MDINVIVLQPLVALIAGILILVIPPPGRLLWMPDWRPSSASGSASSV